MRVDFINDNSISEFEKSLNDISLNAKSILILSCDENQYDLQKLDKILKNIDIPIIGGIFPQIIYKNKNYSQGTIITSLNDTLDIKIIKDLSVKNEGMDEEIEDLFGELNDDISTMFVFVDGLSKNINQLISGLFDNFGLSIDYIGGGAGSLSFEQKPCIFTNEGLFQDCALLANSKLNCNIGVKHGWIPIKETIKVTKSNANEIIELDYKPAFEVYKEIVEKISTQKFTDDNFFDIAKGFPLGINKISGEAVVRDPIMQIENKLICVGDVPVNSFISILKGDEKSLVNAAKEAAKEAALEVRADSEHITLFIDCISRVLFLEDKFENELNAVCNESSKLIGALTLGEIANNKKHYLEFYNKTAVVGNIRQ